MEIEWRESLEVRQTAAAPTAAGEYLEGYAIVFNELSGLVSDRQTRGTFREVIAPGAFTQSLRDNNISLVFLHSDNSEYADTASGTLTLTEDSKGIRFRAQLPPYANTLKAKIQSGAIRGMSFGFHPRDVEVQADGTRVVKRGDLRHISPVFNPAYAATEVKITKPDNSLMRMKLESKKKFI
jgi:HK97 family phage prohead protease